MPYQDTTPDAACSSVVVNWTNAPSTIQDGQYLQLRLTSSATDLTAHTATVTVGKVSDQWNVTTEPPDPCIGAIQIVDDTTPGTHNYVIPAGVSKVVLKAFGAGGGGAKSPSGVLSVSPSGGGGGGSVVERSGTLLVAGGGGGFGDYVVKGKNGAPGAGGAAIKGGPGNGGAPILAGGDGKVVICTFN